MQSSRNRNLDYSEASYKSFLPVQKTSAEIINEARSTLRTLRTQRPFTPRDERRKLFGSTSSRTPENRPPSAFRYEKKGAGDAFVHTEYVGLKPT